MYVSVLLLFSILPVEDQGRNPPVFFPDRVRYVTTDEVNLLHGWWYHGRCLRWAGLDEVSYQVHGFKIRDRWLPGHPIIGDEPFERCLLIWTRHHEMVPTGIILHRRGLRYQQPVPRY